MRKALIPPGMEWVENDWRMSPGLIAGDYVFLTGFTGQRLDGYMSPDPAEQITTAFDYIEQVLAEGGMTFADVVDVTSFHVGLQDHKDVFRRIWEDRVVRPYPAWTAIEVAGFITPGSFIEVKVVARRRDV